MNDKNRFLDYPPQDDLDDYGDAQPMPKTHEMIESSYLRKEDVGRGALATVKSFEQTNVAQDGQPPKNRWLMFFREFEKPMVLNSTNIQLCEQIFGSDDTDEWIGKQLVLYNDPNVSMQGRLVGGIRVRASRAAPAQAASRPKPLPLGPEHRESAVPFSDMDDDIPF